MSQFNLKKKKSRESFFYNKNNVISQIGSNLIFDKIEFINKNLDKVLVLDSNLNKSHPKFVNYEHFEFEKIKKKHR